VILVHGMVHRYMYGIGCGTWLMYMVWYKWYMVDVHGLQVVHG
jgi:hypothetical protein